MYLYTYVNEYCRLYQFVLAGYNNVDTLLAYKLGSIYDKNLDLKNSLRIWIQDNKWTITKITPEELENWKVANL